MNSLETGRSSLRSTLTASLLLALSYVLGGIADSTVAREFLPLHGPKPFADSATANEKAMRPPRAQWRQPQADAADDGSQPKSKFGPVAHAVASAGADLLDVAPGETPDVTRIRPSYALLRTRDPRDPPGTLA